MTCFKDASVSMNLENVAKTDRRYTITATKQAMTRDICRRKTELVTLVLVLSVTYSSLRLILLCLAALTWEENQVSLNTKWQEMNTGQVKRVRDKADGSEVSLKWKSIHGPYSSKI